jgi:hypothetical protein
MFAALGSRREDLNEACRGIADASKALQIQP